MGATLNGHHHNQTMKDTTRSEETRLRLWIIGRIIDSRSIEFRWASRRANLSGWYKDWLFSSERFEDVERVESLSIKD